MESERAQKREHCGHNAPPNEGGKAILYRLQFAGTLCATTKCGFIADERKAGVFQSSASNKLVRTCSCSRSSVPIFLALAADQCTSASILRSISSIRCIDFGMRRMIFDEAIYQFRQIEATGHMPEVVAQCKKVFAHLRLGNNIEVAPKRHL